MTYLLTVAWIVLCIMSWFAAVLHVSRVVLLMLLIACLLTGILILVGVVYEKYKNKEDHHYEKHVDK